MIALLRLLLLCHATRTTTAFVVAPTTAVKFHRTTITSIDMGRLFDTLEGLLFPTVEQNVVDTHREFLNQTLVGVLDDAETARASLVGFLNTWAKTELLSQDNGLATPVTVSDFAALPFHNQTWRMTVMFRPPPRYLSYKEQKSMEKGVLPDRKGAKLDSKSPGGIAIFINIAHVDNGGDCATANTTTSVQQLRIVAQRYGVDRDTVIKEASERAIIRRLEQALRIWQKVRDMKV